MGRGVRLTFQPSDGSVLFDEEAANPHVSEP